MSKTTQELYVDLVNKQMPLLSNIEQLRPSFAISKPDDMRMTVLHGAQNHSRFHIKVATSCTNEG